MKRIVFYGKSGVGKSTTCKNAIAYYEEKGNTVEVLKLAYPLYLLQKEFYDIAEIEIDFYEQNQKLIEIIATNLREIKPNSLIDNFNKRLSECNSEIIINDDLRDTKIDYPSMKKNGFIFIKIECDEELRIERLKKRNDLKTVVHSKTTDAIEKIAADFVINTSAEDKNVAKNKLYEILNTLE